MWIFIRLAAAAALLPLFPQPASAAPVPDPTITRATPAPEPAVVRAAQAAILERAGLAPGPSAQESGVGAGVVAAGPRHTCAIVQFADLWCWGANPDGRLGDGTTRSSAAPVRVSAKGGLAGTAGILNVQAGRAHTCALTLESAEAGLVAYCWGANDEGQLGDGSFDPRPRPAQVAAGVVQIVTGADHTCVLTVELTVSCWGRNNAGQLGAGTLGTSEANPQEVPGLTGVIDLAAGDDNTCALDQTGKAWCWGAGSHGRLGDGGGVSADPSPVPVAVAGGPYGEISLGRRHACALGTGSAVYCWGADDHGQAGGRGDRDVPTRNGQRTYTGVRAGGDSTCGVTSAGEAFCWGANGDGQLGTGDLADRARPAAIDRSRMRTSSLARLLLGSGSPRVADLSVGAHGSCGVDVSMSVYCTRSGLLTAVPLAPGSVTGVRVAAQPGALRVSWTAPEETGADRIGAYVALAFVGAGLDDSRSCTANPALTCTIPGLAGGEQYTVLVAAVSRGGISYSAVAHGVPAGAGSGGGLPVTGPGPAAALGLVLLTLGWSLRRASRSVGCRH
ncbi:fibronectin type III domain-containing protein [Actinoplanes friuliensis]|uniref:Chromosome condensation regulator RCC1 n=1 Tax=Actinoplanes friuliensis DSM 7358 TaxID=1246995 RepID=U5W3D4_9ACTN|nr:fibronectin type III domain-containing protein [Actinoplanes friuliensis]AGZ43718.1 chromosome condensation regulator RCC1 [Actinoplanes friuliensis DSM 7358]